MNPNLPLETFLPPSDVLDVHKVLTKDWNGMNNGVFPIRVHPWSVELLSAAIAYPPMNLDVELFWPDQSALSNILETNNYFAKSVVYYPLRWFNAYMGLPDGEGLNPKSPEDLQVHQGDLLVHFPGTPRDSLEETLGPYLAIAEAHQWDWELSLERTGYAQETEEFWKRYRYSFFSKKYICIKGLK
jgi:galactosyl transferase GMA12/MNN10 family